MTDCVLLRGYHYSVYTRIVRVALSEKRVAHDIEEIDPFTPRHPEELPCPGIPSASSLSCPMERSTSTRPLQSSAMSTPPFRAHRWCPPSHQRLLGRPQVVSIIDSYGYRPMIRQVFAHRVFRPAAGEKAGRRRS